MTQVSNSGKNAAVPMPDLSAVRSNVHFTGGQKVSLGRTLVDFSVPCQRVKSKMRLVNPVKF